MFMLPAVCTLHFTLLQNASSFMTYLALKGGCSLGTDVLKALPHPEVYLAFAVLFQVLSI